MLHELALVDTQSVPGVVGRSRIVRDHDDGLAVFPVEDAEKIENLVGGVAVVKVAGTYASVVKTVEWMMDQGLNLLAHDAASADFLARALFYALK